MTSVQSMTGAGFGRQFGDQPGKGATDAELRVEQWANHVAEKAQRYQDMQARVADISVTEHSGDGAVRLTVGSSGLLTDLELTDRAGQLQPRQLAAVIMQTMRRAQGRLSEMVAEVMRASVGDDTDTVDAVVSSYRLRFPEQPEADEPAVGGQRMRIGDVEDERTPSAPSPSRRPRPGDDDDDGWDRPLLRE